MQRNLKRRRVIVFGGLLAISAMSLGLAIKDIQDIDSRLNEVVHGTVRNLQLAEELRTEVVVIQKAVRDAILNDDQATREAVQAEIVASRERVEILKEELMGRLDGPTRDLLAR